MNIRMKIVVIIMIIMTLKVNAQENILVGLNSPAYGVRIKANWANYSGGWARGFSISNENNTKNFFQFGAKGSVSNGISSFSYGYIGTEYYNCFMVFRPNGNVGIGTITPDSKLSVNGTIHTKEVKVDLIGWSDFVFDTDYNLPTLEDVELHIKENGCLKDIPSAKEVKNNGILLGEINAKLLQKVEELTLYTINQEKKLKEQNSKLIKQEQEISELKSINKKFLEIQERLEKLENK